MSTPRPVSYAPGLPAASVYTLEQRVQKAYRRLLFDGLESLFDLPGPDALTCLVETVFASYFTKASKGKRKRGNSLKHWQAEERLQYDIPEIISRLPAEQLTQLDTLLTAQDIVGAVTLAWYTYRPMLHKLDPQEHLPDDRKQVAAANLGRPRPAKKPEPKNKPRLNTPPFGPPLVLTPPPVQRLPTRKPPVCRLPALRPKQQSTVQLSLWPPVAQLLPFLGSRASM